MTDGVRGPTAGGIAELLIDAVELVSISRTPRGMVAQVRDANRRKSFLLRQGDQLADGDVAMISRDEVVFKQIVTGGPKPFREVVKTLP